MKKRLSSILTIKIQLFIKIFNTASLKSSLSASLVFADFDFFLERDFVVRFMGVVNRLSGSNHECATIAKISPRNV